MTSDEKRIRAKVALVYAGIGAFQNHRMDCPHVQIPRPHDESICCKHGKSNDGICLWDRCPLWFDEKED
jgi:hypothetical protein